MEELLDAFAPVCRTVACVSLKAIRPTGTNVNDVAVALLNEV